MSSTGTHSLKFLAASLTVAAAGALSLTAFADDPATEVGALHEHPHPGRFCDIGHHPEGMPGLPMLGGRHLDDLLDALDATEAQRTQIRKIRRDTLADLKAQHEAGRALHEQFLGALTAPQVDTAAAEKLRQQMLVQHEAVSKRLTQSLLAAAQVLTPEQRAKLAERLKTRRQRMEHGPRPDGSIDGAADLPRPLS